MQPEQRIPFLKHPDSDVPADFEISGSTLTDRISGRKYPVVHQMIDFEGIDFSGPVRLYENIGFLSRLSRFFSQYLDSRILTSVFAGGGIGFANARKKIMNWIDRTGNGATLFLEPEEKRLLAYVGPENCITMEDFASKNVLPAPGFFPDINASMEKIPIRSKAFGRIISYFVIEHVNDPRRHMAELSRILKPGGHLILGGPGDVYPSHRIPFNYFNITRFGYAQMLEENHLEVVEEYFPSKSWLSILYLAYTTLVRNSRYNQNAGTKLFQLAIFILFLGLSPLLNLTAIFLDRITPFDHKIYSLYLVLARKKEDT